MTRLHGVTLTAVALSLVACGAKSPLMYDDQVAALPLLPECSVEGMKRPCQSVCGMGEEECVDGTWQNCSAERPKAPRLAATVRDISDTHPDFERLEATDRLDLGIVAEELGADDTPAYAGMPRTPSTDGAAAFESWYHDGVDNFRIQKVIELVPAPDKLGVFEYKNSAFFPIDGEGFGNEGRRHNYHFTLQAATAFRYLGGETFAFSGDDDLWIFINRHLVIDLGGYHSQLADSVALDEVAERLGLQIGETYPLHLFFAERHTVSSNFNIRTTIAEFEFCE